MLTLERQVAIFAYESVHTNNTCCRSPTEDSYNLGFLACSRVKLLACSGVSVLAKQGFKTLAAQGFSVLAAQGFSVLAAQGFSVLAAQGFSVLAAHGLTPAALVVGATAGFAALVFVGVCVHETTANATTHSIALNKTTGLNGRSCIADLLPQAHSRYIEAHRLHFTPSTSQAP